MKVTLERSVLLKSLGRIHRVVERRNTIPILSNVLLNAQAGRLTLKATDLDLEIVDNIAADIEKDGGTTVPAHVFHDIVRKLPEGAELSLTLSDDGSVVHLVSGRSQFSLAALPMTDFPDLAASDYTHSFALNRDGIQHLIEKTRFAISSEETRYYLNGIYLHVLSEDETMLRAVATDGHRLALSRSTMPQGAEGMPGIIIPGKTVNEILRLIDEDDVSVNIDVCETKLRITYGEVILVSKLIDGSFPDYERVIPRGNDRKMVVTRDDFAAGVDRVSTVLSERNRAVKLSIEDGRMVLTVNSPDAGSAEEEIPVTYEAEGLEIGFNGKYLTDIAGQITSDEMVFMLSGPGSPALISSQGDTLSLYVLMPMRV